MVPQQGSGADPGRPGSGLPQGTSSQWGMLWGNNDAHQGKVQYGRGWHVSQGTGCQGSILLENGERCDIARSQSPEYRLSRGDIGLPVVQDVNVECPTARSTLSGARLQVAAAWLVDRG